MIKIIKKILIFNNNQIIIKKIKSLKVNHQQQIKDKTLQNQKTIAE